MKRGLQGRYETVSTVGEKVQAFVPHPLPPVPAIEFTPALRKKFDDALLALGKLDSASALLPDVGLFLYMFVRKEAVLSSMIEGTQSSLADLLMYESQVDPGVPLDDVEEVSNYVAAMNHGLARMRDGFPLSLRLVREMHAQLLSKGRGAAKTPGEFRHSQNWIGGSRPGNAAFVPPPVAALSDCLSRLERYWHDEDESSSPLLQAALTHVQFETIHPFLDGNGRLGRLLITLLLCHGGVLHLPLLYVSCHFKVHRPYYYELLNEVRTNGDWERWLAFFAEAVIASARQGLDVILKLDGLLKLDRARIAGVGRGARSALLVYEQLLRHPIAAGTVLREKTGLSDATVNAALRHLRKIGIVEETTGRRRDRLFRYKEYMTLLNTGLE